MVTSIITGTSALTGKIGEKGMRGEGEKPCDADFWSYQTAKAGLKFLMASKRKPSLPIFFLVEKLFL